MNEPREEKRMSEPKKAKCAKCKALTPFEIRTRDVLGLDAVTDHVVVCLACGNEIHSCYTNANLDALRKDIEAEHEPIRHAHLVRRYNRKFTEFQAAMEKRVAAALTRSAAAQEAAAQGTPA